MKVALVGQHDVLGNRIELQADAQQFLPGKVEHHVVFDHLDQDAPVLPEERDVPL
jgi:hypothetical protein